MRRILKDPEFYSPNPHLQIAIQPRAFYPTKHDTDGLSLFRELFSSAEKIAASGTNPKGYAVAQLVVERINALSLSVIPNPVQGQLPGHALIPEINYPATKADIESKNKIRELSLELARIAGERIIAK